MPGLEPVFAPSWPLAGLAIGRLEPDDPDLAIPRGALEHGFRDMIEQPFPAGRDGRIQAVPAEPLGAKPAKGRQRQLKWTLALAASCILHATVALFLLLAVDESVLMEGAEFSGIAFLGDAPDDQMSAGDTTGTDDTAVEVTMITMIEAKPVETIEAKAVPAEDAVEAVDVVKADTTDIETLKPVAEPLAEQVEAASAEPSASEQVEAMTATAGPVAQPERAEAVAAEPQPTPAAKPTPEILTADQDEDIVQKTTTVQPAEPIEAADATPVETAEVAQAEPAETATAHIAKPKPVEVTETVTAEMEQIEATKAEPAPTPVERKPAPLQPKPVKQAEKKPAIEKPAAKPKEARTAKKVDETAAGKPKKSGNGGQNQIDARRGQADGRMDGRTAAKSNGGKNAANGNAAVSNYPGKVASKLRRALRYPAEAKRQKLRGQVRVSFVVSAGGGVGSIRVVSSSGSAILDTAAMETVRRAAPFPAIPEGAGRSNWPFTVPLAFSR